jgi:hypothetical protein
MPIVTLLPKHALWYGAIDKELTLSVSPISFIFPFCFCSCVFLGDDEGTLGNPRPHLSGTKAARRRLPAQTALTSIFNACLRNFLKKGGGDSVGWRRRQSVASRQSLA